MEQRKGYTIMHTDQLDQNSNNRIYCHTHTHTHVQFWGYSLKEREENKNAGHDTDAHVYYPINLPSKTHFRHLPITALGIIMYIKNKIWRKNITQHAVCKGREITDKCFLLPTIFHHISMSSSSGSGNRRIAATPVNWANSVFDWKEEKTWIHNDIRYSSYPLLSK